MAKASDRVTECSSRDTGPEQLLSPALLQHANMAMETEWNCPICRDIPGELASVTPCVHLFCLGCIVRWAKAKPSCPLCRQAINSIIFSVRSEEDFLEIVLPSPSGPPAAHPQDEQGAAQPMPRVYVAGYPTEVWAGFFQDCPEILKPLLPWLNQELKGNQVMPIPAFVILSVLFGFTIVGPWLNLYDSWAPTSDVY
uniref:RING-type E3 ubiquitin transferase n=1 Tax=Junco hyemalis TaxID=40217 RepID=A0A8C5IZB5_JUNHY